MSSDSTELYYAHMEADRNEAADAYFKARPGFGELEKSIFRAGYERAYQKLWPLLGAPASAQETSPALVCRHGVDTAKTRCLQCYPLQGDKFDPVGEEVQSMMDRDRE